MNRSSSFLVSLAFGLLMGACGDDVDPSDGGGGSGSEGGGGEAPGGGGSGSEPAVCDLDAGTDLDSGAWDERFTIAGVSGHDGIAPAVHDFAVDVDGSVVAAGRFQYFEGERAEPLLRFVDGQWEPARTTWEIEAPLDGFSAIAISGDGDLALATNDSFGDRDGEIWIDDGSGLQSIGAFDGQVRSLAFYDGALWVAGLFAMQDDDTVGGLAVYRDGSWQSAPGGAIDGLAYDLVVADDTLWVGGAFAEVGGVAAANVASYDTEAWTAYDFQGALGIFALGRTASGQLYAGGAFGEFASPAGLARWTGTAWEVVGGGLAQYSTRGVVTDIAIDGEAVDVTGCFSSAGGLPDSEGAVTSVSLARWTGEEWESLDEGTKGAITPWFAPAVCGDEGPAAIWDATHQRLAHDGERLFAGGMFGGVDGVLSQALIVHDGDTWVAQGQSGGGIGGSIDQIAAGGSACDVYGAGAISHVGGERVTGRVVHFDGTKWVALSDDLPRDAYCPDIAVSPSGELAAACTVFDDTGAHGVVLRRDGDAAVALEIADLPSLSAVRWSPSGALVVAGSTDVGGGWLGLIEGTELTILEDGFDNIVNEIDVRSDNDIVVAGAFTKVGTLDASRIARWDGTAWTALGDGMPGQVLALGRQGDRVYASSYDEGNGAYLLGEFDGTEWKELATAGSGLTADEYFSFNSIVPIDGALLLGGTAELDDGSGRGALVFDGTSFRTLGGGVGAIGVGGIAVTPGSVWVAGVIAEAGPAEARVSTVGVARYVLGDP